DAQYVPSEAHVALEKLPWSAVLTTNYDGLLRQVLAQAPVTGEDDYARLSAPPPAPRLFQLHGSLADPHTLTRDDYRLWPDKHPQAMAHLRGLLQRETVLFIGYSLSDRHFDEVMALVRNWTKSTGKITYAWMWRPDAAQIQLL